MNILYINHYAGSIYHGMEFRPYYLAREWVKSGHRVRIIAADFSHLRTVNPVVKDDFEIEDIDGIEYQWVKAGDYKGNGVSRALTMFRFVGKLWLHAKKIAEEFQPDVVISSSTYPLDAYAAKKIADLSGVRFVHEVHDMWPITPMELYGMPKYHPFVIVMQWGENFFCRNADKVVSILPCAKDYLVEHGMATEKFIHIPNGIDLDDWKEPLELPEEHSQVLKNAKVEGRFVIGFFGSHTRSYNIDYLIKALENSEQKRLFIALVGSGNYKEELVDLAGRLNISKDAYSFLPPIPKRAIPSLLKKFDACYVGAIKNTMFKFGIGMNKLFDSMMSGKPLLYAVAAPNDFAVEYNCGISVAAENVDALCDGIKKLMALDKKELEYMGNNGHRAVLEHYNYSVLSDQFLQILKK